MTTDTMERADMSKTQEEPKGKTIVAAPTVPATTSMAVEYTNSGVPTLWEKGGGMTNTGDATVIAGPDGGPKVPFYVRRRGSLSNSTHAQIPVEAGDLVVEARHHRGDFDLRVYRIDAVVRGEAQARLAHRFVLGQWDTVPSGRVMDAVRAAEEKACCYHCREPFYVRED